MFIQTVNPVTPSLEPIFTGYIPRPSVSPRDVLHQFCPRSSLEITLIARHFIVVSLSMNLQMLLIECREFTFTAMHHGSVTLVMNLPQMTPQQLWSLQNPLTNVALVMFPADVSLQIVFAAAFDITKIALMNLRALFSSLTDCRGGRGRSCWVSPPVSSLFIHHQSLNILILVKFLRLAARRGFRHINYLLIFLLYLTVHNLSVLERFNFFFQ